MNFKRKFLDYVLFESQFKEKNTVWILNFIKSNPIINKNITFIDNDTHIKLFVSENTPNLMLNINDSVYLDGGDILYYLNKHRNNKIYVHFRFLTTNSKYETVKLDELYDIFRIRVEDKNTLKCHIDEALTSKNKEKFLLLTKVLKNLE